MSPGDFTWLWRCQEGNLTPDSLAALAKFGWIPMAAAMVGLSSSAPLWTGQDWRPILGTSVDTTILPPHLSSKESLLLLSQWIRIPRDDLHIRHATNSWLSPDKVKVALGPDCDLSPHPAREVPLNISTPYIDMLLGPQKPARGQPKQTSEQEELNTLPAPEEVLVTLRLQVDSCGPSDVSALIQILLGGTPIRCRNHHLWIHAGMTAHTVLLAQTKVGFLTGGRRKSCHHQSEITLSHHGSSDMKGLLGAATVMGTLMYGAGHVWAGQAHFCLHDGELSRSPPDETFIHMLQ